MKLPVRNSEFWEFSTGNVIAALTDAKGRQHIPYRDSKLTRILEDRYVLKYVVKFVVEGVAKYALKTGMLWSYRGCGKQCIKVLEGVAKNASKHATRAS